MISSAYVGLTVPIMSLKALPRAMKLNDPACLAPSAFSISPPSPSPVGASVNALNCPWYARLWIVNTVATRPTVQASIVLRSFGTSAACQSWLCTTSGCQPSTSRGCIVSGARTHKTPLFTGVKVHLYAYTQGL